MKEMIGNKFGDLSRGEGGKIPKTLVSQLLVLGI